MTLLFPSGAQYDTVHRNALECETPIETNLIRFGENVEIEVDGVGALSEIGMTALATAAGRALETVRPGGLIEDQFAELLVRASNCNIDIPTRVDEIDSVNSDWWQTTAVFMGVRTKYFDDRLAEAVSNGIRQVVLLAAGLDTRAFRLEWPAGSRLFELDQLNVLRFKERALSTCGARPQCFRLPVPTDFGEDWRTALLNSGFDPGVPTFWLAEGLLPYMPAAGEQVLLETISQLSVRGSRLAADYIEDVNGFVSHMQKYAQRAGFDLARILELQSRELNIETVLKRIGWNFGKVPFSQLFECYSRRFAGLPTRPPLSARWHTYYSATYS